MGKVQSIWARRILDSRGNPTVEVDIKLESGNLGRAAVPSGASTGSREALELRDGQGAYVGKDVQTAVNNVNNIIAPELVGQEWTVSAADTRLLELDGTPNKSKLGANAILGVSLALTVALSQEAGAPLWQYIHDLRPGLGEPKLPRPMFNILNGGAHADWSTDIQEYMIMPAKETDYPTWLRQAVEVYHHLGKVLKEHKYSIMVGNEGGFAPSLTSNSEAFDLIQVAIEKAGYTLGAEGDFVLAVDVAASEFFNEQEKTYNLRRDNSTKSSGEMIEWITILANRYPIWSIEGPLAESDWDAWTILTRNLSHNHQVVGDDLLVTNPTYIRQAVEKKSCNALLVKLNQIGTLTETLQAMEVAHNAGWTNVPSHRSGETEDVFLAHLAVGTGAGQIKTGAPARTDRTAKYNELLRIAEQIKQKG